LAGGIFGRAGAKLDDSEATVIRGAELLKAKVPAR
jgi:hypothetical protein